MDHVVTRASGFWDGIVPRVDAERCKRCADCPPAVTCLAQAFRRTAPQGLPVVEESLCFGCYSCAGACPYKAILLPKGGNLLAGRGGK